MNATQRLTRLGQSLWLDNITRDLLDDGTLARYIRELSVTGLTSNPTIFDKAIRESTSYDADIAALASRRRSPEDVFFELALADLRRAADLFLPIYEATAGRDGWVSLEVSPLLADDTAGTIAAAVDLHERAGRPNLYVKIPGTLAGLPAIEEATFAGVPVNVTLLFSREHYLSAAEAWMRGVARRVAAGRPAAVSSVASLFVSRWDAAVHAGVPAELRNRLGIAVGGATYRAYRDLLASLRWRHLVGAGAVPQRLLWASTGTKDPSAPETLYVDALAAPDTVDTVPEKTLLAFAKNGEAARTIPVDGGDAEAVLTAFRRAGIDDARLAATLQREGAAAFAKSWRDLMGCIEGKMASLAGAH